MIPESTNEREDVVFFFFTPRGGRDIEQTERERTAETQRPPAEREEIHTERGKTAAREKMCCHGDVDKDISILPLLLGFNFSTGRPVESVLPGTYLLLVNSTDD
jgi:hypothetical protein